MYAAKVLLSRDITMLKQHGITVIYQPMLRRIFGATSTYEPVRHIFGATSTHEPVRQYINPAR